MRKMWISGHHYFVKNIDNRCSLTLTRVEALTCLLCLLLGKNTLSDIGHHPSSIYLVQKRNQTKFFFVIRSFQFEIKSGVLCSIFFWSANLAVAALHLYKDYWMVDWGEPFFWERIHVCTYFTFFCLCCIFDINKRKFW